MQETLETWVQSLGWEDPLEEGMATHSSTLAWRILVSYTPWGHTGLDTTSDLVCTHTFCPQARGNCWKFILFPGVCLHVAVSAIAGIRAWPSLPSSPSLLILSHQRALGCPNQGGTVARGLVKRAQQSGVLIHSCIQQTLICSACSDAEGFGNEQRRENLSLPSCESRQTANKRNRWFFRW